VTAKSELRARAHSLAPATARESAAVVRAVKAWLAGVESTTVLVYLSMPGEIPIEEVVGPDTHTFAVTRTPDCGWLTIHEFDSEREHHPFGFEQPAAGAGVVPAPAVGVVLVPGLAFDRRGNRLGRGKGYYDELLSRLPAARRVGITVERRVFDHIPTGPHDVAMTHLATERGLRRAERDFRHSSGR